MSPRVEPGGGGASEAEDTDTLGASDRDEVVFSLLKGAETSVKGESRVRIEYQILIKQPPVLERAKTLTMLHLTLSTDQMLSPVTTRTPAMIMKKRHSQVMVERQWLIAALRLRKSTLTPLPACHHATSTAQ